MKSFEDYVKDIHATNYTGADDDMYDSYERFIESLHTQDIIDFADIYGRLMYQEGKIVEIKEQLAKFNK